MGETLQQEDQERSQWYRAKQVYLLYNICKGCYGRENRESLQGPCFSVE